MDEKYMAAEEVLKKYGQEHLLSQYEKLSEENKSKLLDEILTLDFNQIEELYKRINQTVDFANSKIEPIGYTDKSAMSDNELKHYEEIGLKAIKEGKLAAVTMAGGQGTRLGHNGPKGTYDIGLDSHKPIFEILCDTLKTAEKKYGVFVTWYIMTSKENNPFPISVQLLNQISAYTQKIANISGITRLLSMNDPKKVVYADFQYPYSEKEWEVFSMLTLDKGYNSTVMAEMKNLEKSMEAVENMKIPKEIPILQFVSKENCRTMPQWEQLHRDIIADKENGEVILLEGSHYLHFEQRSAIVQKTIQWIENR